MALVTTQGSLPVRVGSWSLGLNDAGSEYVLECETPPSALVFRPPYVSGEDVRDVVATLGYYGVPECVAEELVGSLRAVVGYPAPPLQRAG